jgi:hypothetical protein
MAKAIEDEGYSKTCKKSNMPCFSSRGGCNEVRVKFQTFDNSDGREGLRDVTVKGEAGCIFQHIDIF